MNIKHFAMALFIGAVTMTANAQSTYEEMELLTVNEQVTTVTSPSTTQSGSNRRNQDMRTEKSLPSSPLSRNATECSTD